MKVVVIGGTGLIGSKTIALLRRAGHEALAAAPSTGVNTLTGEGVAAALHGADVVVDLANSPSFEASAVMSFFETHEKTLLAAEARAGVRHHVALSIVGADRSPDNGYFRAKVAQEDLIKAAGLPYTIVRSTQFMEFLGAIADAGQADGAVHIATGLFQPIAADDVAATLVEVALGAPKNGTIDLAGPERASFETFIRTYVGAKGDGRPVSADAAVNYFGAPVVTRSLVPTGNYIKGGITLAQWLET